MTTMTTLNDVRATLIAQGYPADQVDAMLNLAGRMVLEGNLATKDDLNFLRDEFTQFKSELTERMAEQPVAFLQEISVLRAEMNAKFAQIDNRFERIDARFERIDARFEGIDNRFERIDARFAEMNDKFAQLLVQFAELRVEMNEKFNVVTSDSRDRFSSSLRWVTGVVIAGIGVNAAVMGIGLAVLALTTR